jgi:hypothetical protein
MPKSGFSTRALCWSTIFFDLASPAEAGSAKTGNRLQSPQIIPEGRLFPDHAVTMKYFVARAI